MFNTRAESDFDSICDEAKEITGKNRMEQYGHPKHNFSDISALWNAYLGNKGMFFNDSNSVLEAKDVAMMMILFKVAREQAGHKRDNIVDIAGYARNIAQIEGEE